LQGETKSQTHKGLKSRYDANGYGRHDLLEVAHLPQQAKQPEGPQDPQLLDPRVAALSAEEEECHRHGYDQGVEKGPAICKRSSHDPKSNSKRDAIGATISMKADTSRAGRKTRATLELQALFLLHWG
jgi:hypothetical protein